MTSFFILEQNNCIKIFYSKRGISYSNCNYQLILLTDSNDIQYLKDMTAHIDKKVYPFNPSTVPKSQSQWLDSLSDEFERYSQKLSWHSNYKIVETCLFSFTLDFIKAVFKQFQQQVDQESRSQQEDGEKSQMQIRILQDSIQEYLLDVDQFSISSEKNGESKEQILQINASPQAFIEQEHPSKKNLKEKQAGMKSIQIVGNHNQKETLETLDKQDIQKLAQRKQRIKDYLLNFERKMQDQRKKMPKQSLGEVVRDKQKVKSLLKISSQIKPKIISFLRDIDAKILRQIDNQYSQTKMKSMRVVMKMIQGLLKSQEGVNLFNSQVKKMWYKGLSNQQIKQKLKSYNIEQMEALKKEITTLQLQIEERKFNHKETCNKHMKKVLYFCSDELLPKNTYFCEECIQDIGFNNAHFGHQIICKEHAEPVRYICKEESQIEYIDIAKCVFQENNRLISNQSLNCETCCFQLKEKQKKISSQIVLLASCHNLATIKICLNPLCIRLNNFKICQLCLGKHEQHQTIIFKKQTLLEALDVSQEDDITAYESLYLEIREKLQIQPIKKAVDSKASQLWPIMKFIEGFAVQSNQQLQKWIDISLRKGQKEDVFVLWAVDQLKRRQYDAKDKREYLEVFNDILQKQLESLFENIDSQLQKFKKSVEKCINLSSTQVEQHLDQKYKEVINKSKGSVEQPMNLMDIEQVHYHRIVKVSIDEQEEEDHKDRILSEWQTALKIYFSTTFQQKCRNINISQIDRKNILKTIDNRRQWQLDSWYQYRFKKLGIQQYLELGKVINNQLIKLNNQFKAKLSIPTVLDLFFKNKLANLKILHLRYPKILKQPQLKQQKYTLCAFDLFKTFQYHPALKQVSISGLEVKNIYYFFYCTRIAANNNKSIYLRKSSQLTEKATESWEWLKDFNPTAIDLSINTYIQFSFSSNKIFQIQQKVENVSNGLRLFPSVSDITIKFQLLLQGQTDLVQRKIDLVIRCFSLLKLFKLVIEGSSTTNPIILAYFLGKLSFFTTITELTFKNITLDQAPKENLLNIQNSLQKLFANSFITNLSLEKCSNFQTFPNSLKSFLLKCNLDFRPMAPFITQILRLNTQLTSIRLQSLYQFNIPDYNGFKEIDLSGLTLLQDLQAYLFNLDMSKLSNCPQVGLRTLSLNGSRFRKGSKILQILFPKLVNLRQLQIKSIKFSGKLLLFIPSLILQDLSLIECEYIANRDIQNVDYKWPYLKKLRIRKCPGVNGKIFSMCKLRGIRQLSIQQNLLQESDTILSYLKKRGIRITIYL